MKLKSLTLENFRVHKKKIVQFADGVNGITGTNGSGKTSILEALCFVVTGYLIDKKEEVMTAGKTRGSVTLLCEIDDKPCTIYRELHSSKCKLEYDGKKFTKAAEVKELWDKLFKIDSQIFNNVIVSKQKEMASLFSGEPAVREKIFQKIFMVPPCEQRRKLLWTAIQNLPPLIDTPDVEQLTKDIDALKLAEDSLKKELDSFNNEELEESLVTAKVKLSHEEQCFADLAKKKVLEGQLTQLKSAVSKFTDSINSKKSSLQDLPSLEQINEKTIAISNLSSSFSRYCQLTGNLNEAKKQLQTLPEINKDILTKKQERKQEFTTRSAEAGVKFTTNREQLAEFSSLDGVAFCPTCKQAITDIHKHIDELKQKDAQLLSEYEYCKQQLEELNSEIEVIINHTAKRADVVSRITTLEEELLGYNTSFSDLSGEKIINEQNIWTEVRVKISSINKEIDRLNELLSDRQRELLEKEKEYAKLNISSATSPKELIEELKTKVNNITTEKRRREEVRYTWTRTNFERKERESALVRIKENIVKNAKTEKTRNVLTEVYEAFHSSNFPRKLIQSYTEVVQSYLENTLSLFNIPYSISIDSGFGITISDDLGHQIPRVSGGQEAVLGLALRLALHTLFAHNFQILCIDEGTQNLDKENKRIYFELIRTLQSKTGLKQVIVIDHSDELRSVVDHSITL